jgi:hypothetical protein
MKRNGAPPVRAIEVVPRGVASGAGYGACEIGTHIKLDPEQLVSYRLAKWEPVIEDALVVCAAIEYCDRRQSRPQKVWGRVFLLRVHVHEPARWSAPQVQGALVAALRCLTGDVWRLEFVQRQKDPESIIQTNFELPEPNSLMIPFSNGMDSWALWQLFKEQNPVLVRLGGGSKNARRRKGKREAFERIPFRVPDQDFKERTGRSRGFKFAMVSGLAAYLSGSTKVIVPESGQGALGPVLVTHRYGDYRSHPVFLNKMERLFRALLDHDLRYEFPRLWSTKGQTLAAAAAKSKDEGWRKTRSCWQKPRQIRVGKNQPLRQCGFCAACILRRISVHAAGFKEPANTYAFENVSAATLSAGMAEGFPVDSLHGNQHAYAVAGAMHFDHLADLRRSEDAAVLSLHARELARALGEDEVSVKQKLDGLLAQHEAEWDAFLKSLAPGSFIRQRSVGVS